MKFTKGNMNEEMKKELRYSLETQFRYQFYNDLKFPFIHSLGIQNILQSFDYQGEYIGILHLYYVKRDTDYLWESEWLDSPSDGIKKAISIQQSKIYDENLIVNANLQHIQSKYEGNDIPVALMN